MTVVASKSTLHDSNDDVLYWLSKSPQERVAAVEILRRHVFGGDDESRQELQRVSRVIRT